MARKVRHSSFENRTARLKLTIRPKPYTGPSLADGVTLLYRRRRQANGTWVLRAAAGTGRYWTKRFAAADDYDAADGEKILTFFEAQDRAKKLTPGGDSGASAPITVDAALTRYAVDLEARGAHPYNAKMPRFHLPAGLLAKPVALLMVSELEGWRNSLLGKIKPATVNRICNALKAALTRVAKHDKRIQNRNAWEVGLSGLPGRGEARNVYLPPDTVRALVSAAYARDSALGLLIDVLAVTGTRPSQAVRLKVEDLHDHPSQPRLTMPKSGKGGGSLRSQKKVERFTVPITPALAIRLKAAAAGRAPEELLLLRADGRPWNPNPNASYRGVFQQIVADLGEDPSIVTPYALRHSSIIRRLLANVPARLVAAWHDTGLGVLERNYAKFISEYADQFASAGLLEETESADNVVELRKGG